MYSNIEDKIIDILEKEMPNEGKSMFEQLSFTSEELLIINKIPNGVNDIVDSEYYSENFISSFKSVIDFGEGDKINYMLDKIINNLTKNNDNIWPINPNENEFSPTSGTKIVSHRVMELIEQKFRNE